MNKTQKLILAIFVPIIFFFIAIFIANEAVNYRSSILFDLGKLGMCSLFIQLPVVFLNFYYLGIKKREIKGI